jgi:hypothetical protein
MDTPGNPKQTNSSRKLITSRKNNLIFIGIVLLIATALAWSALSNPGVRVANPSRSARNALPATARSTGRQATAQEIFADPTVAATRRTQVPASPAAGRDRSETRPVANTVVSLDREAPDVVSTTAPIRSSSNLEVDRSSIPAGLIPAPRVPTTAMIPGLRRNNGGLEPESRNQQDLLNPNRRHDDSKSRKPREDRLIKAHSFNGDVRKLPYRRPATRERRELEDPELTPAFATGTTATTSIPEIGPGAPPTTNAPAPPPSNVFEGLDRETWGSGSPPDTNGDVGPTYYIQTVNSSIGIFRKSDGVRVAAFTFDTLMSQGAFGNLCDTNNFGDPVVLYDTFEDRWIITDFAFVLDGGNDVQAPAFQCFAASKNGDPVNGGWNFYSREFSDDLGDYPKFGIWPDGLYMSANMFSFGAGSTYQGARALAFNKAQMYAGSPTVKIVSFDVGGGDFTVIPSNARLQTGTPPLGEPNMFVSTSLFLNAVTVYKFHVDWNSIALSTFTGPDTPIAGTSWPNAGASNAPQPGTGTLLDVIQTRAMVQNQYTNLGGTESLWVPHTVRRGDTTGFAAPRWYQLNVTGGTVAATIPQAATWDPEGANVIHRFMPSLALDRAGNMAMGYSTSNSATEFPSIKYAGRLAGDPINTFSQTEQTFFTGTASQLTSSRWGDYSAMTLDPDGCTFWYTSQYATGLDSANGLKRWKTKFGSIPAFPGCTTVGAGGTVSGVVTTNPGGAPITGVTVMLGARSTTTDGSGGYSFTNIPAGTYPGMAATLPGYVAATATTVVVTDGGTTTQNFSLATAPAAGCLTDTSQPDFLAGISTNVDPNASPGDVKLTLLPASENSDQVSSPPTLAVTNNLSPTDWTGQTFRAGITGNLTKLQVGLGLLSGTSGTITVEIRDVSGSDPGTTVLATSTAGPVTNVGSAAFYTVTFATPAAVTSGTSYSIVLKTSVGDTVFGVRGSTAGGSTLANGQVFTTTSSGTT